MRKVQLEVSPTSCITSSLYLFYQSICSAWKQFSTNELAGEQQFKQWCHWRWEGEFTKATFFKYKMLRSTLYGARQMYIKDHEKATNYMPLKAHFMDESCQITEGIYWEKCVAARMDKSMHSIHSKLLPISCHARSKKRLKNWQPQTPALKEKKNTCWEMPGIFLFWAFDTGDWKKEKKNNKTSTYDQITSPHSWDMKYQCTAERNSAHLAGFLRSPRAEALFQ